jgi:hypothetical protein
MKNTLKTRNVATRMAPELYDKLERLTTAHLLATKKPVTPSEMLRILVEQAPEPGARAKRGVKSALSAEVEA